MSQTDPTLARAFAPVHKRALGVAIGVTAGLCVFLVTAFQIVATPDDGLPLGLLAQYFFGYRVTWTGAVIGFWWGFVAGFAGGWFLAFCRNLAVALWVFVIRTKASFRETSDFLDHI
jgi:hypothetical protein